MSDSLRRRIADCVCECSGSFLSLCGYPEIAFHCAAGIGQSPALGKQPPSERGPPSGPPRKRERHRIRRLAFPSPRVWAGLEGGAADDAARRPGSHTEPREGGELHVATGTIFWIARPRLIDAAPMPGGAGNLGTHV